jgi:hypothetical protein
MDGGKNRGDENQEVRRGREQRVGPSSRASLEAAASNCTSDGSQPPLGKTQLSGRLRLVTTRTFPAALAMGIAQHTMRGTERPLVPMWRIKVT